MPLSVWIAAFFFFMGQNVEKNLFYFFFLFPFLIFACEIVSDDFIQKQRT